jgi:hypothetical protein
MNEQKMRRKPAITDKINRNTYGGNPNPNPVYNKSEFMTGKLFERGMVICSNRPPEPMLFFF